MNHDIPSELNYTSTHEWSRLEDGIITIGITHHAQDLLGDIVHIELPEIDDEVEQQAEICVIESTKAASDVYAPLGGVVVAINEELLERPELVNQDPYHEGWLFKIKLADEQAIDELMDADAYREMIEAGEG